jgi:hydrogenase maturation protease
MNTLLIGLGNPILTDDGVGIHTIRLVETALPPDSGVDVVELSAGGLLLMEALIGYERVILVDSLWAAQEEIGQVIAFDTGDLHSTLNTASNHDVDLPTALRLGREMGAALPADARIQIVGVTARHVFDFGDWPTPPVAAAIPHAARLVLDLLGYADVALPAPIPVDQWRL